MVVVDQPLKTRMIVLWIQDLLTVHRVMTDRALHAVMMWQAEDESGPRNRWAIHSYTIAEMPMYICMSCINYRVCTLLPYLTPIQSVFLPYLEIVEYATHTNTYL